MRQTPLQLVGRCLAIFREMVAQTPRQQELYPRPDGWNG